MGFLPTRNGGNQMKLGAWLSRRFLDYLGIGFSDEIVFSAATPETCESTVLRRAENAYAWIMEDPSSVRIADITDFVMANRQVRLARNEPDFPELPYEIVGSHGDEPYSVLRE